MNKQIDLKELLESKMNTLEPKQDTTVIDAANSVVPKNLMFSFAGLFIYHKESALISFFKRVLSYEFLWQIKVIICG